MNRWIQFFEDTDQRLSMTRLLCFLSFFPSSYIVLVTKSETALGYYVGAYVIGYLGGKTTDIFMGRRKIVPGE